MSSIFGTGGVEQTDTASDLFITSPRSILATLGDDAGARLLSLRNQSLAEIFSIDSLGNIVVSGDLRVQGDQIIQNTEEVFMNDTQLTLNSSVTEVTENADTGIAVKRAENTLGQIDTATDFASGTGQITLSASVNVVSAGDLFSVVGSDQNDGLYKAQAASGTTITIDATATENGVKTSLEDESGATASVSQGGPAFVEYIESSNSWEFGQYNLPAVRVAFTMIGLGGGGANAFSASNPDVSAQGTNNTSSFAANIGVFDEFSVASGQTQLQSVLKVHDDAISNTDGTIFKSGSEAIGNATDTVVVTFGTAFGSGIGAITFSISNTVDATPILFASVLTTKSVNGFTVVLSGNTDSANYVLEWQAIGN